MNSRWSREPRVVDCKPALARLTPNDIEIFKILAKYRFLQSDDIGCLLSDGKYISRAYLTDRLDILYRKPNCFINRPAQQRETANANYRPLVYELDTRGVVVLREHGHEVPPRHPHRNFAHELMVWRILASIEIGVRTAGARLVPWNEISGKLPPEAKNLDEPWTIKGYKRPDSRPFGIYTDGYYFFAGIEADTGSEPISTSDLDRSSIQNKFLSYSEIAQRKLYKSQWGTPNFFVPIITTTKTRMESMRAHLTRLVQRGQIREQEAKIFIFGTFPCLTSYGPREPANGRMFTLLAQRGLS